jgi:beta-mannosidase
VSAHVPGDEVFGTSNYRKSTVRLVHIHTSYDRPEAAAGVVRWDVFHIDGRVLLGGSKKVSLRPMRSVLQRTLDVAALIAEFGREQIYMRIALDIGGRCVSEDSVLFTLPRFIDLPKPRTRAVIKVKAPLFAQVEFSSPVFQHRFAFDFTGHRFTSSDNFFDLYPGETRRIEVDFTDRVTADGLSKALAHMSLADTY